MSESGGSHSVPSYSGAGDCDFFSVICDFGEVSEFSEMSKLSTGSVFAFSVICDFRDVFAIAVMCDFSGVSCLYESLLIGLGGGASIAGLARKFGRLKNNFTIVMVIHVNF